MQKLKRLLAVCLMLAMMPVSALCESMLLPQLEAWQLGVQPLQISAKVQAEAVAEFDENRLSQFNALMKHLTFSLQYQKSTDEQWGSIGVAVDDKNALSLTVKESAERAYAQLSCVPDKTYASASGKGADVWLLGGAETQEPVSLNGLLSPWLSGVYTLFDGMPAALIEYTTEKSVKTKIGQMGTARIKQTITIPADALSIMPHTISALSPDTEISETLANAVFSGKQTITIFRDEAGQMLKVTYTGRCGADEDHLRKVNLTWTMKRTENDVRDDISLKTPAVKGNDYNTLTFKRTEKADEYGTVDLKASLTHNSRTGNQRTSVTGEADLEAMMTAEGTRLTGEITRSAKENGGETHWLILEPDFVFAVDDLHMTGTAAVETRTDKRTENRYLVSMEMTFGSYFEWLLHENMVDMDVADDPVRDEMTSALAKALIRPLVLLPYEDTLYLSDGLEPDVWQSIVETAREALQGGF